MDTKEKDSIGIVKLARKLKKIHNSPLTATSAVITLVMFWGLFLFAAPRMTMGLRILTIVFLIGITLKEANVLYHRSQNSGVFDDELFDETYGSRDHEVFDDQD